MSRTSRSLSISASRQNRSCKLTGNVKDGSGAAWPLYATLTATTSGNDTEIAVSDALTGAYTMKLYEDTEYTLDVSAYGYAAKDIT